MVSPLTAQPHLASNLMLVFPDEFTTTDVKSRLRDIIGDFCTEAGYMFSLAIVSSSTFRERAGFLAVGGPSERGCRYEQAEGNQWPDRQGEGKFDDETGMMASNKPLTQQKESRDGSH